MLKGNRLGQYRIRMNDQYRICFGGSDQGATEEAIISGQQELTPGLALRLAKFFTIQCHGGQQYGD